MKRKKVVIIGIIFIIIIAILTGIYTLTRNKGNIIFYDYLFVVTSHAPSILEEYIIYDSGVIQVIQQYPQEELLFTKKIRKKELEELEVLIEKVSEDFVNKKDSTPKETYVFGAHRVVERYVYNIKNEKISLYDIESDELENLETFIENLKKKYCK